MYFGNQYKNLFLEKLIDNHANELSIIISKSSKISISESEIKNEKNEKLQKIFTDSKRLIPDETEVYEIYFDNYLLYQNRNESYSYERFDKQDSIGEGLIIFRKSSLLDYIHSVIMVDVAEYVQGKTELKHFGIYTLNHIIDIITFDEPVIKKLSSAVETNPVIESI